MPYIGNLATALCSAQTSKRACIVRCLAAILAVVLCVAALQYAVQQLRTASVEQRGPERATLQAITADQIVDVDIANRCSLSTNQLPRFVAGVQELSHFRNTPDEKSYQGIVRITLRSGSIQAYRFYQEPSGIVLELVTSQQRPEYLVSRTLVDVLQCTEATGIQRYS